LVAKISKETTTIQNGIGTKVGSILNGVWAFVLGFVVAFYWGWHYTLILLGSLPVVGLLGVAMGMMMQSGFEESMKAYAQSCGYAE
jgi:ABC-type multidrug transport system fused ATPase/permease subunit